MGTFEVQGIVSAINGEPLVQFRQLDAEGKQESKIQVSIMDAREIAQNINEAATNAIYEAAIFSWAKEQDPVNGEEIGIVMIDAIRKYRADKWGFPSNPEDWRTKPENE